MENQDWLKSYREIKEAAGRGMERGGLKSVNLFKDKLLDD